MILPRKFSRLFRVLGCRNRKAKTASLPKHRWFSMTGSSKHRSNQFLFTIFEKRLKMVNSVV